MGIQPVDIDGDGQLELVGHKKFEASNPAKNYFTIQVVELTTKKTKLKINQQLFQNFLVNQILRLKVQTVKIL